MAKHLSTFFRNIISTTLRALICFSLLRTCGATTSFSDIDLSTTTLDPLTKGFIITGNAASDNLGFSVSTAGDIDNDGYEDIIIGAPGKNSNRGAVYVIYGGETSSLSNVLLSTIMLNPATTGFMITGNAVSDGFGQSVSIAGDIDNDGYDDIIIGAEFKNGAQGAVYVIYGGPRSLISNIDLSSTVLSPTSTGFMITGGAATDYLGREATTVGDMDNDGYDDIITSANGRNSYQGAVYVIYGGPRSSMSNIVLSSTALIPTSTGFMITGNAVGDHLGFSVSTAGDINNDGFYDIIIGAPHKNSYQGASYVIYGRPRPSMSNVVLSTTTLDPLITGFTITGNAAGDYFGVSVSTAGDINKDGYDDIIVGAHAKNTAYVIYGGPKSSMSNIVLSSTALIPTSTGFMITGNAAGDYFGWSVRTARDINKDGYDDIIVGAYPKNSNQGAAYIIYGGPKSSMSNIALSSQALDPLTTGFTTTGNAVSDQFGYSVNTAGDINNDGYPDIIIGAKLNGNKGAAYVIYGAPCLMNCNKCVSPSECTQCATPYLLYQSDCFNSCPQTTFASAGVCEACPTHCNQCTSSSLCTECTIPYLLYKSECLDSCPLATFASTDICKDCPSHCVYCKSQASCIVCEQGYTLSDSLCVLSPDSSLEAQQKASQAISSTTQGIGSVVSVGSSIFPFSALVSRIVQNTRYLNLSVTSELMGVYKTWDTDLIPWDVPNIMSDLDHFETSLPLFAQYDLDSPFLVNFWPTLVNIVIGFGTFIVCIFLQKVIEHEKYEGWASSLVRNLTAGSFNFALIQTYACLEDILFSLVLDAKTNPFNSFFSWTSMICAVLFLAVGCLLVFFNFWTVSKYQSIKSQGTKEIGVFNERNKYWELFYSDFNDQDLWCQSFFAILVIRSTLSSLVITVFFEYPLMQTSYLMIMDGAIILFMYFKTPFNTLRGTLAQYYYEIITLLVHLCAFILALQDSSENPSDTVKRIMSTGILYLNTALISGAIGFMFIEIYETIRLKNKVSKRKQKQSVPKDNQETLNLTQTARPFYSSEADAQKRQHWINRERSSHALESDLNVDSSREFNMYPSQRLNQQRNQSPMPVMVRHRPQGINQRQQINNPRNPGYIINYS